LKCELLRLMILWRGQFVCLYRPRRVCANSENHCTGRDPRRQRCIVMDRGPDPATAREGGVDAAFAKLLWMATYGETVVVATYAWSQQES